MTNPKTKAAICAVAIAITAWSVVMVIMGEWLAIVPAMLSGISALATWNQIKKEKNG